jgi:hypothetical protein
MIINKNSQELHEYSSLKMKMNLLLRNHCQRLKGLINMTIFKIFGGRASELADRSRVYFPVKPKKVSRIPR